MKLVFIKPCREVREREDGTYVIDGVFHELAPQRYPCELPPLHVAMEFEQEPDDPDEVSFGLRFADPSGAALWEMEAPFTFVPWDSGIPARFWCTVVVESPPVIEGPGVFRFEVRSGNDQLGQERLIYGPATG